MKKFYVGFVLTIGVFLLSQPGFANMQNPSQSPEVRYQLKFGYLFIGIDNKQFKISKLRSFSQIFLRYHLPTHTVYVFYKFRPNSVENVAVIQSSAEKEFKDRSFFALEPVVPTQEAFMGKDRLPILGSTTRGDVIFAPLSAKLSRTLWGDISQDDVFIPNDDKNLDKYLQPKDFIPIIGIPPTLVGEVPFIPKGNKVSQVINTQLDKEKEQNEASAQGSAGGENGEPSSVTVSTCNCETAEGTQEDIAVPPAKTSPKKKLTPDLPPVKKGVKKVEMIKSFEGPYMENNSHKRGNLSDEDDNDDDESVVSARYGLRKVVVLPENS